jgi:hypothetical protein
VYQYGTQNLNRNNYADNKYKRIQAKTKNVS